MGMVTVQQTVINVSVIRDTFMQTTHVRQIVQSNLTKLNARFILIVSMVITSMAHVFVGRVTSWTQ